MPHKSEVNSSFLRSWVWSILYNQIYWILALENYEISVSYVPKDILFFDMQNWQAQQAQPRNKTQRKLLKKYKNF